MSRLTAHELLVRELTTEEVIESAWGIAKATHILLQQAIEEQNLGKAGEAKQAIYQGVQLLDCLNQKLNGKKEATVIQ